jgi:integrase
MAVYKKKMATGKMSKNFYYDFIIDGKRFAGSTKQVKKKAALAFIEKKKIEIKKELNNPQKNIELKKAFELFLKKPIKKTRSKTRISEIRSIWNDFVSFLNNEYPSVKNINQITFEEVEEYIYIVRNTGRYSDKKEVKLSAGSLNKMQKVLMSVFEKLKKNTGMKENPFAEIPTVAKDIVKRDIFTSEELALIGEKANDFIYHIFLIGMNTGFREGDICTLEWSDINFYRDEINRTMRKTKKSVNLPLLPPLKDHLMKLRKTTIKEKYISPKHAELYLNNRTKISIMVRNFLNNIGIKTQITVETRTRRQSVKNVHSLRHAFVFLAMLYNVPLHAVQNIVGHVDSRTTLMYADHMNSKIARERLSDIPNFLALNRGN